MEGDGEELRSLVIVFVSFVKENTPKNVILRPKESKREVLVKEKFLKCQ